MKNKTLKKNKNNEKAVSVLWHGILIAVIQTNNKLSNCLWLCGNFFYLFNVRAKVIYV